MGMLKTISLKNYKCFKDETMIDIAPLTILCGVNSSGKSSILKSLLMLKQSYEKSYDSNSLLLNGDYTQNGSFSDVSYNGNSNSFYIENSFQVSNSQPQRLIKRERDTFKELKKIFYNVADIKLVTLTIKLEIKRKSIPKLKFLDNIINSYSIVIDIVDQDNISHISKISLNHKNENIYDIELNNFPNLPHGTLHDCACYFDSMKLVNLYFDRTTPNFNTDTILSSIFSIFRIVSLQYKNIHYIAPLRNEPMRTYLLSEDRSSVGLHGEFTTQIIANNLTNNFSAIIPPITETCFKYETKSDFFCNTLNSWLDYLGIEPVTPLISDESQSIRLNIGKHNILDVGFGVSQILPIITTGLLMKKHESIILQQPEIHLHPKMQMNFADFLLSLAVKEKNVIIETHSDHLINRILRRILEDDGKVLKNQIQIYFVDKKNIEFPIKPLHIDLIKGFDDAPEDFFSQFGSETMNIFNAGMSNMQKK